MRDKFYKYVAVKDLIFLSHACVLRERIIGLKDIGTNIQFCVFIGHSVVRDRVNERTRERANGGEGGGTRVVESCR